MQSYVKLLRPLVIGPVGSYAFSGIPIPLPLEKRTGCGLVSLPLVEVGAVPVELFIII